MFKNTNVILKILFYILLFLGLYTFSATTSYASAEDEDIKNRTVSFYNSEIGKQVTFVLPLGYGTKYNHYIIFYEHSTNGKTTSFDSYKLYLSPSPMTIDFTPGSPYIYSNAECFYTVDCYPPYHSDYFDASSYYLPTSVSEYENYGHTGVTFYSVGVYIGNEIKDYGEFSSRIYASNYDILTTDGDLYFSSNSHVGGTGGESTPDYNNIIDGLLNGSGGSISDITDGISGSDWTSILDEGDTTSIANAPSSIGNAFSNIFGIFNFVDNVKSSVYTVYNTVRDVTTAPVFNITLNSKYLSGTYTIIDLSWYAPYKELGDNVICMFFYLGFIWYVFTHLPNIINGAGSSASSITEIINNSNGGNDK